jgi:hypothetical protein
VEIGYEGTDEGVSQALAGYRLQLMATLTGGLQQVRVLSHALVSWP